MCEICDCGSGIQSLGEVGCPQLMGRAEKFVFTEYHKEDGTVNELDLSAVVKIDQAFIDDLVALDADKPWKIGPKVLNYDSVREPDKTVEFDNATVKVFAEKGGRTVKGQWIKVAANLADILLTYNCTQMGFYIITQDGEIVGMEGSGWKKLAPIKIQLGSFLSLLMPKTNVALNVQMAMVEFMYDSSECDGNLKMIDKSSFAAGFDIKQVRGLVQVQMKETAAVTSTTVDVATDTNQGSITNPILVEGMIAGDFLLTNLTTGLPVAKTLTEIKGKYTLTYAAQTTGDEMELTAELDGFQFSPYKFAAA